jgi:hypothetical protein
MTDGASGQRVPHVSVNWRPLLGTDPSTPSTSRVKRFPVLFFSNYVLNLVKSISPTRKIPKIASVDFLETLRRDLCSGVIKC